MVERRRPISQSSDRQRDLLAQGFKRISRVEREAPTDPEEIYACLLSACHLELGALTFLSLTDVPPGKQVYELVSSIDPMAPGIVKARMAAKVLNYLDDVFIDVALVAQESFIDTATGKQVKFYSLTPFGKRLQGIGFYILESIARINEREKKDLALPQLFSKSANAQYRKGESREAFPLPATRRSPYTRARVIEELGKLIKDESITQVELARRLGVYHTLLVEHLKDLMEAGILEYKNVNPEKSGEYEYTPTTLDRDAFNELTFQSKKTSPVDSVQLIIDHITNGIQVNPDISFNVHVLTEQLYPIHCQKRIDQGRRPNSEISFRHTVSNVLSVCKEKGVLEMLGFISRKRQKDIQLTSLGREVAGILTIVRAASTDDKLTEEMTDRFKRDFPQFLLQYASVLLERQRTYGKSHLVRQRRWSQLLDLFLNHTEGIRVTDMGRMIGVNIKALIYELKTEGILDHTWSLSLGRGRKGKHGRASIYSLTPKARGILERHPDISYEDLKMLVEAAK